MDEWLRFSGPVRLLIVERALFRSSGRRRHEGEKKIQTRIIMNNSGSPASELRDNLTVEFHYGEAGSLVLRRERAKDGALLQETKISYKSGLPFLKERTGPDGSVRERREYRYDSLGRLEREISGSRKILYQYEDDPWPVREYRYFGNTPELVILYKRNGEGNILSAVTMDQSGKLVRQEEFSYNGELLCEAKRIGGEGNILRNEYYEYDCFHEGNWLKRTRYNRTGSTEEEADEVIYRSIAYSDSFPEVRPISDSHGKVLREENRTLSFGDGSVYRGEIRDGMMHGRGYLTWTDGSSYKGDFNGNSMDGTGILTWPNGDIYSGTFREGKMEGIGRLRWNTGKTFYGIFEDNRRTNQGIIEEE